MEMIHPRRQVQQILSSVIFVGIRFVVSELSGFIAKKNTIPLLKHRQNIRALNVTKHLEPRIKSYIISK